MDFTENPPVDIELGHDVKYYEDKIPEYKFVPPPSSPRLKGILDAYSSVEGKMSIDGSRRSVKINFKDGVSGSLLIKVSPEDTLFGIPLNKKPKKVNKKLRNLGHETFFDLHDIALLDERMVVNFTEFYAEYIHWHDKKNTTVEHLIWTIS